MLDACIQSCEKGKQGLDLLGGVHLEEVPQFSLVLRELLLKKSLRPGGRADAEHPCVPGALPQGDEAFFLQGGGQLFDVLPGTAQEPPQLRQGHRPLRLPDDGQQHELLERHLRDTAVKDRLQPVAHDEQGAEDRFLALLGAVGKTADQIIVFHGVLSLRCATYYL